MAALELANELDALGHEDRIVALALGLDGREDESLPPLRRSKSLGVDAWVFCTWQLRRVLQQERPDVVLAHGGTAAQVVVVGNARGRPPVVWQQILGFPDKINQAPRRQMWRHVARRVDGAVTLDDERAGEMRSVGFTGPLWVISNFRSPARFLEIDRDTEAARLRETLDLALSTPLIGLVGHLVEQKRPERALDVLAQVRAQGQPAHLVVAGDGPLRKPFEDEARARGLEPNVSMLGHRNDVERVLGGVDLAVLTSDVEGVPGVAIEAAMAGCPFVTFPLGGVGSVVIDGVTGVVVDALDTTRMSARVVELLRDDATRRDMSIEARRRSRTFAASRSARRYDELLSQCHREHVQRKRQRARRVCAQR